MRELIVLLFSITASCIANAACNNPAPRPQPVIVPSGQGCPSGYSQSGNTCIPGGGATYIFLVPRGQACPSNYAQQGPICIANSNACYAYYSGQGNCPSGYSSLGPLCISN